MARAVSAIPSTELDLMAERLLMLGFRPARQEDGRMGIHRGRSRESGIGDVLIHVMAKQQARNAEQDRMARSIAARHEEAI